MNKIEQTQQDPELLSLESSLAATEAQNVIVKRMVPPWIYYYIAFVSLVFVLGILALINSSRPEDPVLLALHETLPKVVVRQKPPEPEPVVAEKPSEKVKEEPKVEPAPLPADPVYKYSMYTPEELSAAYAHLQSNSSDRLNIYRAEVFSLLGFYQNQQKLKSDGQYFATRCLQTNPQDLRANRAVGLSYLILGQYENAKHYHDLINGKMSDPLTNWIEAELAIKEGNINLQNGFAMMEQINSSSPTFYPAAYVLIQEYLHRNDLAKARTLVEFWREKSLTNLPFVHAVAELLDRQQQYVELLYYLNNFEKTYPTDWSVLFYLGKGNIKLQKKELAKSYFQKILDAQENYLADQSGNAYLELGKIELLDNDFKKSTQNLYQASQRLPNDPAVKQYLASSYFKNEEYEKAIDTYQQILSNGKDDPKTRIYLGMSYFEVGQFKLAEKNLLASYNQGLADPVLLYYLAKVEEQKGNIPQAKDYLQKAVSSDPKYAPATKMLEKLNSGTPAPAKVSP